MFNKFLYWNTLTFVTQPVSSEYLQIRYFLTPINLTFELIFDTIPMPCFKDSYSICQRLFGANLKKEKLTLFVMKSKNWLGLIRIMKKQSKKLPKKWQIIWRIEKLAIFNMELDIFLVRYWPSFWCFEQKMYSP